MRFKDINICCHVRGGTVKTPIHVTSYNKYHRHARKCGHEKMSTQWGKYEGWKLTNRHHHRQN